MHPFNQWIQIHHELDKYPPSEDTIRAARRSYLGMVSYIDDKVGELLRELKRLGIEDETIVMFTSDHGDMQGEHGMWFKRTFYEWAMRVPLIFWQPSLFKCGKSVNSPVSLVDLFPTLTELGEAPAEWPGSGELDGASLVELLRGDLAGWDRPMLAEYLGEGILQPMRMIREGDWKYVDVNEHAPLLFNLAEDPHERHNRSGDSELSEIEQNLRSRLLSDWDGSALRQQIMADQQQRLMLNEALEKGEQVSWDYQPFTDASQQYVRRGFSTQKTKRLQRWPYVPDDD
jgi:choline-sulfatase